MAQQQESAWRTRAVITGTALALVALSACTDDEQRTVEDSPDTWCEGVNIRFFAGGSPGDGFAPILTRGAEQAAEDLGAEVNVVYSDWEPEQMLSDLRDALAGDVDGIAFTGHPGDEAVMPLAQQAEEAGILMTYRTSRYPRCGTNGVEASSERISRNKARPWPMRSWTPSTSTRVLAFS